MTSVSIIMPCYNEEATLERAVLRVLAIADAGMAVELIIVDDASLDGSVEIARGLESRHDGAVRLVCHDRNQGKGAALRTGFAAATGEVIAVQDADLEYDPRDLRRLIHLIERDTADVVFGSRFLTSEQHRVLYFWHSLGNRVLTFLSNMMTDLNLTDMETCYKVFRREALEGVEIEEDRFGFEPEIVAKVARRRLRIFEMGISYAGRTYEEGKKIGLRDGFRALYCILRYNCPRAPAWLALVAFSVISLVAALPGGLVAAIGLALGLDGPVAVSTGSGGMVLLAGVVSRLAVFGGRWRVGAPSSWLALSVVVVAALLPEALRRSVPEPAGIFAALAGVAAGLALIFFTGRWSWRDRRERRGTRA